MKPKPPFVEEINIIKQYVNKDSICLDIGANIGSFTIFLASIAKYVYAFEPAPDNYEQLYQNCKNLKNKNVKVYQAAVSDKTGTQILHFCPNDNGMHRLYPSKWCEGGDTKFTYAYSIDDFVRQRLLRSELREPYKIDFVKIDVEGWEYHVIMGMLQTIERDHPVIMMEFHPPTLEEAGTNPQELYSLMINLGYNQPIHCLLHKTINTYEELINYTNDIPAINILWTPK